MSETAEAPNPIKGPQVSREIFGGVLEYDGAGHYPGLELLNLALGTAGDELFPKEENIAVTKRAHDFARQLVWDDEFDQHPERRDVLVDEQTEDAIRRLMECLQLEIPSSNKRPTWERAHFFPYSRSLVHWDVRRPRKGSSKILIERRYLRGGGALAFRILRMDPDEERLNRLRKGFEELYSTQESPLGQLASVLAQHSVCDSKPRVDEKEAEASVRQDELEDLYRDGMVRIVEHNELSSVARIRALMTWTGFWLIVAQSRRAAEFLEEAPAPLVCDCAGSHAQLRRASQRSLKEVQAQVFHAAGEAAERKSATLAKKQHNTIKGFFWATAASIKLLNAWRGRRHFTLGLDVLETLVLAACDRKSEITFEHFVDSWLYGKCGLIVGRSAAEQSGMLEAFDASLFEDNENDLVVQMEAAGLLTQYSDATRMVSTGGLL